MRTNLKRDRLPSPASSMFFGCPHRSSMIRLLSAALRSCSFFSSSAAFFLKSSCTRPRNRESRGWKRRSTANRSRHTRYHHTYTELLLPVRRHETLLGLLGLRSFFHTLAHLGPLAVDFRLFRLLSLVHTRTNTKCYHYTDAGQGAMVMRLY